MICLVLKRRSKIQRKKNLSEIFKTCTLQTRYMVKCIFEGRPLPVSFLLGNVLIAWPWHFLWLFILWHISIVVIDFKARNDSKIFHADVSWSDVNNALNCFYSKDTGHVAMLYLITNISAFVHWEVTEEGYSSVWKKKIVGDVEKSKFLLLPASSKSSKIFLNIS